MTNGAIQEQASTPKQLSKSSDPCVHPWGGLATTRETMLTVLDCFLDGTCSLQGSQ